MDVKELCKAHSNVNIFADIVEDEALNQIDDIAKIYNTEKIRIMPDVHSGTGCTIGTTIELGGKVTPNMVGVDIGCGILLESLGNIEIDFDRLDDVIRTYIPCGHNVLASLNSSMFSYNEKSFKYGLICNSHVDIERALLSQGTLGGGNHFIEIDEDKDGCKYLIIHSGSRHLGVDICKYYQGIAVDRMKWQSDYISSIIENLKSEHREKEIESTLKGIKRENIDKNSAYLTHDDAGMYLNDMRFAKIYASTNRLLIALKIRMKMGWNFDYCIDTVHNYIDYLRVLRKGAVSAREGEKLVIPMNMSDGCLICTGKGNPEWNCSAPHGAGRLMSRKKAKETIDMPSYEASMNGIYTTSMNSDTIDEAPMAYKPMSSIVNLIGDTVTIDKIIKPIYNFKAGE